AYWRLRVVLYRNVCREHQRSAAAPPSHGKPCGLGESGQGKLLHRLKIRALRVRPGRTAVRQFVEELRELRVRAEHGEERFAGDAASHCVPLRRTDYVDLRVVRLEPSRKSNPVPIR